MSPRVGGGRETRPRSSRAPSHASVLLDNASHSNWLTSRSVQEPEVVVFPCVAFDRLDAADFARSVEHRVALDESVY
jgi:hypothetical protein